MISIIVFQLPATSFAACLCISIHRGKFCFFLRLFRSSNPKSSAIQSLDSALFPSPTRSGRGESGISRHRNERCLHAWHKFELKTSTHTTHTKTVNYQNVFETQFENVKDSPHLRWEYLLDNLSRALGEACCQY